MHADAAASNRLAIEVLARRRSRSPAELRVRARPTAPQVLNNGAWYRVRLVSGYSNGLYQTSYLLYVSTMVGWLEYTHR